MCLCVCLSLLITRLYKYICSTNDTTYLTHNEGVKFCEVFSKQLSCRDPALPLLKAIHVCTVGHFPMDSKHYCIYHIVMPRVLYLVHTCTLYPYSAQNLLGRHANRPIARPVTCGTSLQCRFICCSHCAFNNIVFHSEH